MDCVTRPNGRTKTEKIMKNMKINGAKREEIISKIEHEIICCIEGDESGCGSGFHVVEKDINVEINLNDEVFWADMNIEFEYEVTYSHGDYYTPECWGTNYYFSRTKIKELEFWSTGEENYTIDFGIYASDIQKRFSKETA